MIVVDVETTGIVPEENSIISIGAVDYNDPARTFYMECRVWAGAKVEDAALVVNGFSREQILDPALPTEAEALKSFFAWTSDIPNRVLAGHVLHFDVGFLRAAASRAGIGWPFGKRFVDLHAITYAHSLGRFGRVELDKQGLSSWSLTKTVQYVGLPSQPEPHNALTDAKLTAEALSRLIQGTSLVLDFKSYAIPEFLEKRKK